MQKITYGVDEQGRITFIQEAELFISLIPPKEIAKPSNHSLKDYSMSTLSIKTSMGYHQDIDLFLENYFLVSLQYLVYFKHSITDDRSVFFQ